MPIFAAEPATTVRQKSPRRVSAATYMVLFVGVAAGVYGWKYWHLPLPRPAAPPQATAKVYIHRPSFACGPAWQEILSQSKSEVRDHLTMETRQPGESTVVSISLRNLSRDTIVPLVNVVASSYVQSCRAQWKVQTEQAYSAAQDKAREAQRLAQEAVSRLEYLRQQQNERLARENVRPEPLPAQGPSTVENPQWSEAAKRVAELVEKRRVLLFQRTPMHPSVLEIDMRIGEAQRELAGIPPRLATAAPAMQMFVSQPVELPAGPSAAEMATAQDAVERLQRELQHAQVVTQEAFDARNEDLRIDLEPAGALPPLPPAALVPPVEPEVLGTILLTATTSVIGLGMISFGAALEPVLGDVRELQSLLPVPIVGVVPAVHPKRRSMSRMVRFTVRVLAVSLGLAALGVVGWLAVCL